VFNEASMKSILHLNLVIAWVWVLAGVVSGALLGLKFHEDRWQGGYASLRRRMMRLGHIAFFGMAYLNLQFWMTGSQLEFPALSARVASWGFALGALGMPLCCYLMAWRPSFRWSFAVPILGLLAGTGMTLKELMKP